jgi:hypothetical protein
MCIEIRGDVLVVLEGAGRLRWEGSGATWRLAGLWPTAADREMLDDHLDRGRPLLVVLDRGPAVVCALVEEVPRVPEGVLIRGYEGEVLDLEVPTLDWLPEPMRSRGVAFADQAALDERDMPRHAVPPLLVDSAPPDSQVRFARRTATCRTLSSRLLDSVLAELFDARSAEPVRSLSSRSDRPRPASMRSGREAPGSGAGVPSPRPLPPLRSRPPTAGDR